MPESCCFRQVDEKHVSGEAAHMQWSPKMDLIAIANNQGEVILYRLTSWQKVWTLAVPSEGVLVNALVWRPDGKVLAIGYCNGQITLNDVENSLSLHTVALHTAVHSMAWITEVTEDRVGEVPKATGVDPPGLDAGEGLTGDCFRDQSAHYLPRLPPFSKSYGTVNKGKSEDGYEDAKKLKTQTDLNILVVGTEGGHIHMYAYGVLPVGTVDVNPHEAGKIGRIFSACLSKDLRLLSLIVETSMPGKEQSEASLLSFDSSLLAYRHEELRVLALKFGQVLTLMSYQENTILQMTESWEDILLEIDSKLMKLAEEKKKAFGGSVSNDFLRLLMFGRPSAELQQFLLIELTEEGLKKLGHSIETSYSNIQKLVLKHLQSVGQALVYHLSDLRGMSLWYDKFGVLGLATDVIQETISTASAFMLKASELQQVIDGSMSNFKAFFRWLFVAIQRLSNEPVPSDISKMTQQDLNFVAQFLKENFTEDMNDGTSGFRLERVGQYLKDEDLGDPADTSNNPWVAFLKDNPKAAASPLLYPTLPEKSLLQVHNRLKSSLDKALSKCAAVVGQSVHCVSSTVLFTIPSSPDFVPRITQYSREVDSRMYMYNAFTAHSQPCQQCGVVRQATTELWEVEATCLKFNELGSQDLNDSNTANKCDHHVILDLSFYDNATLSVLLEEDNEDRLPVLAQLSLGSLDTGGGFTKVTPETSVAMVTDMCLDGGGHIDGFSHRRLENMRACQVAVSGTRRVACVLHASKRRVRLFLMDAEDDEEEEEEDEEEGEGAQEGANRTDELGEDEAMEEGGAASDGSSQDGDSDGNKENETLI